MRMDFDDYQKKAAETNLFIGGDEERALMYLSMGFAGETGEILNKLKKVLRDDGGVITAEKKKEVAKELGDALWYLSQLAELLDASLGDIAAANIEKLASRKERGTLKGDGDNR